MAKKPKIYQPFQFKQFAIEQNKCAMKIGTDGVLLGAWCNINHCNTALDIGTGTGVIAIMLAQRGLAKIYGVEIDGAACEQANGNMTQSPWANRLTAIHGKIQQVADQFTTSFDLIVSNPPFFSKGTTSPNPDKNLVRHTFSLTHQDLLRISNMLLAENGRLCIILPFQEGINSIEIAKKYKLYCTKITHVKSREDQITERVLLQFEKKESYSKEETELIVYKSKSNLYTADYINLTKAFYLKM